MKNSAALQSREQIETNIPEMVQSTLRLTGVD